MAAAELRAWGVRAVVIGGSAGSIEVLRRVLPALARHVHVPVLVAMHVHRDALSNWSVVFPGCLVAEAEDKEPVVGGRAYLAPPNYHLLAGSDGLLSLSTEAPVHFSRPAIDVLFESAVWSYGRKLLGIMLSGANADGAAGLAAIHRAGGLCWVQDPRTAAAQMMPTAALQAVPTARVLTVDDMVASLVL